MLLELGWDASTNLPDEFGHRPDGPPNYFLDLARPVPLEELALLAVSTLVHVYGAEHPGVLEYSTGSEGVRRFASPISEFGGLAGVESDAICGRPMIIGIQFAQNVKLESRLPP